MSERRAPRPERERITHIPLERTAMASGGWTLWEEGKANEGIDILPGMIGFARENVLEGLSARPLGKIAQKILPDRDNGNGVLIAAPLQGVDENERIVGFFQPQLNRDRGLDRSAPLHSSLTYVGLRTNGSLIQSTNRGLFQIVWEPRANESPDLLFLSQVLGSSIIGPRDFISDAVLQTAQWEVAIPNEDEISFQLPDSMGELKVPPVITAGSTIMRIPS